jgi:hypothetical protein
VSALQVYYESFNSAFSKLPPDVCGRIESKIDQMGLRLASFPHERLKGAERYRLRVDDYRIILRFRCCTEYDPSPGDWASTRNLSPVIPDIYICPL